MGKATFTCKLDGRKPTHSGKSATHSRHFTQMGQSNIFRYFMADRGSLVSTGSTVTTTCSRLKLFHHHRHEHGS